MSTAGSHTQLVAAVADIVWELGARGLDGVCCAGLSLVEHRALHELEGSGVCAVQELGAKVGLTKSGATRLVDRLGARGLLVRERSEDDGRVCCVALTGAGRDELELAARLFGERLASLLVDLPADQRRATEQALTSLGAALRREATGKCC